jgi:hypothetical protein
VSTAK